MLLLGVSCAMEQRLKQRTHERVNSRLFDLASKESARNKFVGNIVNQVSFEFIEENWRNLEDLELDLGLIRLCELQRVEHHFAPGTRVKMASGEDDWKLLDDIARDDLILTGVQCDNDKKHRSFITFERDEEGSTEMSGELVIGDVMYDIDGRTGELYLEDEIPAGRDDDDRRRLATLAPGQLDLKIHVTMAENLVDYYGSGTKAILKVMEAFDWGWDALYDLGYNVIITSMEFVDTVPVTGMVANQNNNYKIIQYMKTSHPPNPANTHLTFHVGQYHQSPYTNMGISGRVNSIGAIYDDLNTRYVFHRVSSNQHYWKSGVTHELGHMVGLFHKHQADPNRLGETGVYCWDNTVTPTQKCCDDTPHCNCPESMRTIMSYCQAPEWGHHFSPGQHHKAKWQLDNPIDPNYATPDLVLFDDSQYVSVAGTNKILQDEGDNIRDYFGISSLTSCRNYCENNPSCNSFTFCTGANPNNCHLKSLVVLGTEPTKSGGTCTSYYRKGIKLDKGLTEDGNLQHMYKDVGNGVNGYCRDGFGTKKYLGDWNVNSNDKCRALCDSFFACAGFQYGRNGHAQDCNLYWAADQNKASSSAWTPCNQKLNMLTHDGYTWRGKGYCRNVFAMSQFIRDVTVTDEIQCAKECNQDPACKGFALGNGSNAYKCNIYGSAILSSGSGGLGGCWAKN